MLMTSPAFTAVVTWSVESVALWASKLGPTFSDVRRSYEIKETITETIPAL
jgi:hypothetical protein